MRGDHSIATDLTPSPDPVCLPTLKGIPLRNLFVATCTYLLFGLIAGLYYREFTKFNDFPQDSFTQLSVAHTHILVLGFIVLLLVLVMEKVFRLSRSRGLFTAFMWTYNIGVVLTSAAMIWHGTLTILGHESSAVISGVAGVGHAVLTAGLILLCVALGLALRHESPKTGS